MDGRADVDDRRVQRRHEGRSPRKGQHDPLVRTLRTIDGRRRGDVGVRLERGGLAAERGRDDEGDRGRARWTRLCAKHPHIGIRQPAWLLLFAHRGLCRRLTVPSADGTVKCRAPRFTHEKPSRAFRQEPLIGRIFSRTLKARVCSDDGIDSTPWH